jgi:hypothetical protein
VNWVTHTNAYASGLCDALSYSACAFRDTNLDLSAADLEAFQRGHFVIRGQKFDPPTGASKHKIISELRKQPIQPSLS